MTDISKVALCNDFGQLELSEYDLKIMDGALNANSGQSRFQSEYFVAHSQLTPYRMVKQCLLELEARHHTWFGMTNKHKRKKIEIQLATRDMENETDELKKQLLAVDIEDMEHDCQVWERKMAQAKEEINDYLNLVKKLVGENEDLLEKAFGYDDEEERKYWITRMAKQAAMDMVSYGRIGTGNMDSIAMMSEEDQVLTLATTLQYNERLNTGLHNISNAVQEGLLENKEHLPKFDVPKVTDQLLADLKSLDNVQPTSQSKAQPESI